jgi:hypothetical protein
VEAIGYATRIHGYAALLGFGMTRRRNQTSAMIPVMGKMNLYSFDVFFILSLPWIASFQQNELPWENYLARTIFRV